MENEVFLPNKQNCMSSLVSKNNPVQMDYFNQQVICGKVSGLNYLHAERVDPKTMKCPGVYEPCSNNTSPENTICVHPENSEENCPITYLDVVYETPSPKNETRTL